MDEDTGGACLVTMVVISIIIAFTGILLVARFGIFTIGSASLPTPTPIPTTDPIFVIAEGYADAIRIEAHERASVSRIRVETEALVTWHEQARMMIQTVSIWLLAGAVLIVVYKIIEARLWTQ
jgi:hypothetical protein